MGLKPRGNTSLLTLLTDAVVRRVKPTTGSQQELAALGVETSCELAILIQVRDTHQLDSEHWGDYLPFFFEERFTLLGKDVAARHLRRGRELGWPVFLEAHFWNAFPIGASPGGDYWLCQVSTNSAATPVFRYDHETGTLSKGPPTLATFVAQHRKATRFISETLPGHDELLDPIDLYRRTYWLTTLLRESEPEDLEAELRRCAPTFSDFESERARLHEAPHLALYWLFAHLVLENHTALGQTILVALESANEFVRSAAELCDPRHAGHDPTGWLVKAKGKLARVVPVSLLEPARRKQVVDAQQAVEERAKAQTAGDPMVALAANPDDMALQIAGLKKIAKQEHRGFQSGVEILAKFAKKGGSPGGSKWPNDWPKLLADDRFLNLLLLLFRRGQKAYWTEALHSDWFIDPLSIIGGPLVEEAFAEAFCAPGHLRRKAKLAGALVSSNHPQVVERFASRGDWLLSQEAAGVAHHDKEELVPFAQACLDWHNRQGDTEAAQTLIAGIIAVSHFPLEFKYELVEHAADSGYYGVKSSVVDALKKWLVPNDLPHVSSNVALAHYGAALAVFSPQEALELFAPVWAKYQEHNEGKATSHWFALGASILVPLLASPGRREYLDAAAGLAKRVQKDLKKNDDAWLLAARHLLHAFRLSGEKDAEPMAQAFVDFQNRGETTISNKIRLEARRILENR